jgi:PAS domain-containing protein
LSGIDPRAVLDAAPVSISVSSAVRDESGKIVDLRTDYVNQAGAASSGMSAEEQIGLLACEVLPEFRESQLFADACRVIETGEPFVHEALFFEADLPDAQSISGTFEVEVHKFGDGLLSVSRDVTARKEAEAALTQAQSEIERRRFADSQIAEINSKIIESLVQVSSALDSGDDGGARRAVQETLKQASRIITDLQAVPRRVA